MKRALGLGIKNPGVRIAVWLVGCAVVSVAGALAGAGAMVLAVLATAAIARSAS